MTLKMMSKLLLALMFPLALSAQVPIKGSTINATVGYQYQGGAPNGWQLCGNGTTFIASATCGGTAFYQFVASNGTALPQRPILNFSNAFSLGSTGSTEVDLASLGSAGTYTFPASITTDVYGRVTSITSGSIPPIAGSITNVTGSRSLGGGPYTNTNASMIYVSGYFTTSGSAFTRIDCLVNGVTVSANQFGATTNAFPAGFACMVPAGSSYQITSPGGGSASLSLAGWYETLIQ